MLLLASGGVHLLPWCKLVRMVITPANPRSEGIEPMPHNHARDPAGTILLIGASRGLGHAMAVEFLKKGWNVVGTVRAGGGRTKLHDLADEHKGRVEIDTVDICEPDQVAALRARLAGREFDTLFVNAGVTNDKKETIADVTTEAAPLNGPDAGHPSSSGMC
jgi:hypothetical protein